ncbi:MAG: molybdenum cofactor biosynthesis protein MoaE [Pseudohongiellaceae bacterium]
MKISIQTEDFDVGRESERLRRLSRNTGAIVCFTGLVRELHDQQLIEALYLEHYPGMTEKSLIQIGSEAQQRWPIIDATMIHRVGELQPNEQIVLVAVSSAHRQAAFEACAFMMDFLKTRAPFWKKCRDASGEHWVAAKTSDQQALGRWRQNQKIMD